MVTIPQHRLLDQITNEKAKRVIRPWVINMARIAVYALIFFFICYFSGQVFVFRETLLLKAARIRSERLKIEAEAEAAANRILEGTITEQLLRYKETIKE